jgi:hypothetical protein
MNLLLFVSIFLFASFGSSEFVPKGESYPLMDLYIPLNRTITRFAPKCDQRFLPDEKCYCMETRNRPNGPYVDHKHLTYILYYNLIEKMPLYEMNNRLKKIYDRSSDIFTKSLKGQMQMPPREKERIPRIMHKIWITHHTEPYGIPERNFQILREFLTELGDVQVFLWVMDENNIQESLQAFKKISPKNIVIKKADELIQEMTPRMREFFMYLFNSRRLTKASDLLRLYALYKYGGIFTDLDITINRDFMFTLFYDMTLFVFRSNMSFLAEIFYMSFSKEHPALKLFFDVWEELDAIETSAVKIIEGVEIHWRMTFLYVFTIGAFDAAFNDPNRTFLLFSHPELKQMITHNPLHLNDPALDDIWINWGIERKS